jgi:hypothetical protein
MNASGRASCCTSTRRSSGRFWEPGKRALGDQVGRPHKNRRVGWQHLHVAIDDHSRLAYAELLAGQDADSCVRFLERATHWYRDKGVIVERVLTDNAKAYHSRAWVNQPTSSSSNAATPAPIDRAPTAKPSASSRHSSPNGHTPAPTAPALTEPAH